MNSAIRKTAVLVAVMFAALLANITYFSVARAPGLIEDGRNRRVRDAEYNQDRGAILVGDTPIAQTDVAKDSFFKYQRSYPQGGLYAHVTGFYSYDYSSSGLERAYNSQLTGTDSSQAFSRFVDILSGRPPTGANVVTRIDPRAQEAAAAALGDRPGAVIAMDWSTGEILTMYSSPTYDPNQLSTHDLAAARSSWESLLNDKAQPMLNRSTTEIFPPGSTFKLVTAAAALESGLTKDSLIDAPARFQLPGSSSFLANSGVCAAGKMSLGDALSSSCNTAFAQLGSTLGSKALQDQAARFGFGKALDTDFRTSASRFPEKPDAAQTALSSIGLFEVAASPLQMLMVTSAIANDGVLMKPHLASKVISEDLSVLQTITPTELGRPISATTAKALQEMMRSVVTEGTGRAANSSALQISGKTGTAMQEMGHPNYAWMVAFAKDPKIAVVAMIQDNDSERTDIAGGRLAGPIVRRVIEAVR